MSTSNGLNDGKLISAGSRASREARGRWANSLAEGEVTFRQAVDFTLGDDPTAKYVSKLRLAAILESRPGWTNVTAVEALQRIGFSATDSILSIRRSSRKIQQFALLMESTAERWRARPKPPSGWPWSGKLSALVEAAGESLPPDFEEFLDGEVEADDGSDDDAAIAAFLDSGEDTSDEDAIAALLDED